MAVDTQTSPIQTSAVNNSPSSFVYAGFGKRLVAGLIDVVLLGILFSLFGFNNFQNSASSFQTVLSAVYTIGLWIVWDGQTVGKKAMGIKVIKADGTKMDVATSLVRYVGYFISAIAFFFGYIWIVFDAKKQGWHDKIAKTLVICS